MVTKIVLNFSPIVSMLFLFFAEANSFASSTSRTLTELSSFEDRQRDVFEKLLAQPYPPTGAWRYEGEALAAYYLNKNLAAGDKAILTLQAEEYPKVMMKKSAKGLPEKENSFHWHAYILERIFFLFNSKSQFYPGRMSLEAEQAILDMLWEYADKFCAIGMTRPEGDFWVWGSENHHAQAWSGFWGASQIFASHSDYRDRTYADGTPVPKMAAAFNDYYKRYVFNKAANGLLVEVNSDYNKYTLGGWYNIADFAEDPVLKNNMRKLLDLFWADWAVEQIDGVRGGSSHRRYFGPGSTLGSPYAGVSWVHFGLGQHSINPPVWCALTSFYRPSKIVEKMALDPAERGEYAYISRRPGFAAPAPPAGEPLPNFVNDPTSHFYKKEGIYALDPDSGALLRYTWHTPDFVMGTSMVEARDQKEWTGISSQNRWDGAIFAGHPSARIFVQCRKSERGSVYNAHWSAQDKGVMIVQRLKGAKAQGQMIYFDNSLKRVEKDGWVFAEAPRAWAAVKVVTGGTEWEADSPKQHPNEGSAPADGGPPNPGTWLVLKDEFSPAIIEIVRKEDFATMEDFQKNILANPIKWETNRLDYASEFYKTNITFYGDYSNSPRVGGKPVNYKADKAYDCPFIQSKFGSGKVELTYGDQKEMLVFEK